ncbi:peptidoglycan DD-metalloendopeptidase family protein [Planktothricoides raciborskii]|uniref:Peptidoglycan DD-metalloendopeptidase family protein n=1 Tax=Planktothricoides raciborskii GIHE-MW2 TaxID=2792601 RepID=A0AAU8J7C7_9CYAN
MSLPTTNNQWARQSGDDILFDGNLSNGESSAAVKQVFSNLSTAILGQPYKMTAGYAYDQSYRTGYGKWHAGTDIGAPLGTPVKAAVGGTLIELQRTPQTNNRFVAVQGDDGHLWVYGHLQSLKVPIGGRINAGQQLASVGNPAAPHLHLEVQPNRRTYTVTNGASPDQNFVLNNTMSPLQAFWQSRGSGFPISGTPTAGNDNITGTSGNDNIDGLAGNDTISGAAGNDTLKGNTGNDLLYGNDGNDSMLGGLGNDTLIGGAGNDVLDGFWYSGTGGNGEKDRLRGDAGADTFVIGDYYGKGYLGSSWAVIEDFTKGQDRIKVQGSLSQYLLRSGSGYGYSSNDTAIVLKSNPNEVLAVALGVSTSNDTIQLSTRDFISAY